MRDRMIKRLPLGHELRQSDSRIRILKQRAITTMLRTLDLLCDRGLEVDHDSSLAQPFAVDRSGHGATTRCQHDT